MRIKQPVQRWSARWRARVRKMIFLITVFSICWILARTFIFLTKPR